MSRPRSAKRQVVRFDYWLDPAFNRIVGEAADVTLHTCQREGADEEAWARLSEAHVYQITAAKDELPIVGLPSKED